MEDTTFMLIHSSKEWIIKEKEITGIRGNIQ